MLVHHLAIGGAATVCNPRARAGAHDRLHRRDQAARGPPQRDAVALADVDVRLAVGHDHHLVPGQIGPKDRAQRLGRPCQLILVARSVIRLEVPDQGAQVAGDGAQLRDFAHLASIRGTHQSLTP